MTTSAQIPPAASPARNGPTRRALLAGAVGGIGALAATVIGRPAAMRATDGETVLVGGEYFSGSPTLITNSTGGSGTGGTGIWGGSNASIGVFGSSGVSTGVLGSSGSQPGPKDKTGVYGYAAQDTASIGVLGQSGPGVGVQGTSTTLIGTLGRATAASGATFGVLGRSDSSAGIGVGGRGNANSTGVMGYSGSGTFPASKPKTGVFGYAAQDANSVGVRGESPAGFGIYGKTTGTGFAGYFNGKTFMSQFVEIAEMSTPTAPGGNRARLFVRDNGASKTQLCVRFPTGVVKVLATEP